VIALIDFDVIVYRAGFASQRKLWTVTLLDGEEIVFNEGISKAQALKDLDEKGLSSQIKSWEPVFSIAEEYVAINTAKKILEDIQKASWLTSYKGFLGTSNDEKLFRLQIAKTLPYKANRPDKPYHYDAIRNYLLEETVCEMVEGIESDDALGIYQREDSVICSIDKDLLQIPGHHFNFVKNEFKTITEVEGWRNFYKQVLTGDRADNIPGLFRVGDKMANKWLKAHESPSAMYKVCENAYKNFSGKENYLEYLHEICNLVYILRKKNEFFQIPE
jgi:hypothetical protein